MPRRFELDREIAHGCPACPHPPIGPVIAGDDADFARGESTLLPASGLDADGFALSQDEPLSAGAQLELDAGDEAMDLLDLA